MNEQVNYKLYHLLACYVSNKFNKKKWKFFQTQRIFLFKPILIWTYFWQARGGRNVY